MAKKIEIIADFDIFIKGKGQIGTAYKVAVPKLTQAKEGHTSGVGDYEISIGQFEKMECSFTVLLEDMLFYEAMSDLNDVEVDFIEAVKAGSEAREGNYEFKGVLDLDVAEAERKKKKEVTGTMSINKAYHSIAGSEAYHIDFENGIAKVGGVDFNEKVRRIVKG